MYNRPRFTSPNSSRKGQQHPQALPTPTPTPPQPQLFYFNQLPNPYFPNPTPSFPNPYLPHPHFQNQQYPNYPTPPPPPQQNLEAIDRAVTNAHRELLAARQTISAWKVSQIALKALQTDSWNSLCFKMQQVPSLYQIMLLEGKVNAFIHCFVEVRKITSLYDLKVEICKNEGVKKFKDLQLGPLLKHPLVLHYFLVPSDVKKVYKITSQEIVSYLAEYMDFSKKKVQVEGFLDFIATKQSVSAREQLCIRIQNLRMHIASIKEARKAEDATLNNCLRILDESFKKTTKKFESKSSHRRPLFPQKKVLDRRFDAISQRVKSFTPIHEVGSNHIRFVSSSSEDESDDNDVDTQADKKDSKVGSSQCKLSSKSSKNSDRVSSCPYPSAIEEMERLGLKSEMGGQSTPSSSGFRCDENKISTAKKRKSGDQSVNIPKKLPKPDMDMENELGLQESDKRKTKEQSTKNQSAHVGENELNHLTGDDMEKFITTWKEACRVHSVTEVFDRMLQFYGTTDRKRKKLRSIFSSFPCIGILDVAVTSIKYGMWDSLYDKLQTIGDHGCVGSVSDHNEPEMIDVEPSSGRDSLSFKDQSHKLECSVSFDDIVKKVASYLEHNNAIPREGKSPFQKQMIFLRMLRDCEKWLAEQFSIEEFGSLGYVDFFQFIEEHPSVLPNEFIRSLSDDLSKKSNFAVSMLQHQLIMMLTQAASSLWEKEIITKQHINILLQKQFPLVSFQVSENGFLEDGPEFLKKHKKSDISSSVLFSVTLLRTYYDRHSLVVDDYSSLETPGAVTDFGQTSGALGTVSNKDAMQCLLKAPMLTDLLSWSHWDLIFAPSLGPLVEWLLSEAHTKDLLCLVTKDGAIIRIDHLATVDEFLDALIKGSSYQAAVKLLSLFSLYGGEMHIPMSLLSLLKCYARRGIKLILTNSLVHVTEENKMDKTVYAFTPDSTVKIMDSELCYDQNRMKKAVPIASRFILSCLGYLPSEFRSFAADIMLSGLQSFTKDAPMAILNECRQANQRLMLHDIGLSLNLLEWITDYHTFSSAIPNAFFVSSGNSSIESLSCTCCLGSISAPNTLENLLISDSEPIVTVERDEFNTLFNAVNEELNDVCTEKYDGSSLQLILEKDSIENASLFIQNIRREEFGLDPSVTNAESEMLKKQHARLGRALHCLSQELYSQDSHFFLELVQNADDNRYPENVEPTLVFILHSTGIVVLNNEQGFTTQNIKALCDVGNSTKKGSRAGYIGQKGIGFKSVFRVTDAPEIHSNGFHVKFDISEGQIGFVLPTAIAPCNIGSFTRLIPPEVNQSDSCWNTCIMLPFKSELRKGAGMSTIISMFSDLHPSLLLFLHRLRCIKLKNMLNDTSIVMRRETIGNGIIEVTHGKEKMSWFVANEKLQCSVIRPDVQTTEIAVAFTLQESSNGEYRPFLDQQPVFAFLPLRTYGLKFILQGDFVLPSSREEVDGDSAWNQWLLSEFPGLFVNAQRPFCALHCFKENPGKAVAAYMSFVPLVGEVHGFFSHLPRMIISKLRVSNCLLLDGNNNEWVPPCRVLRGWNEQARVVLPDNLLHQHLGFGYLNKDIMLSDSLAKALGVQEYGPRILINFMSSICGTDEGVRSLGMDWLLSWLNALYMTLAHSSGGAIVNAVMDGDLTKSLGKFPFIPLADGTYSSLAEGTIWLPCDAFSFGFESEHGPDTFPSLYAKLRTVNPYLLSSAAQNPYCLNETPVDNVVRLLYRIGIQRLSAHELVKLHILPALSDDIITESDNNLMAEYLSFVMVHLQSSCSICHIEREHIMSELKTKAFIHTSYGYKRSVEVDIHFSKEFGNPVDMTKLIDAASYKWHEVDVIYLKHSSSKPSSFGLTKWREFFQELGITDFVKIVQVEKRINDVSHTILKEMMYNGYLIAPGSVVKDWESPELVHLLSALSSQNNIEKNKYLLEVLDKMWDDYFSAKAMGFCIEKSTEDGRKFKSSFLNNIRDVQWIASSIDQSLHYPKNLFYDCEEVRALLGNFAPYAVPQVRSRKFLTDIGFKAEVTLEDTLDILEVWRSSKMPLIASMGQMSKFYAFIWDGVGTAKATIMEEFSSGLSIFVPLANISRHEDPVSGILLSANEVYWHDPTGSVNLVRKLLLQCGSVDVESYTLNRMLSHFYHSFHDFFVNGCKVRETPSLESYIQILLQLSHVALPSRAANAVFRVLLKWANDVKSGLLDPKEIIYLKECLLKVENAVLPTVRDKWVSLHSTFGLICWCDNEELKKQFEHSDDINFLYFGKLGTDEKEQLPTKLSGLMQTLGIPSLSEVITRQAVFYGSENCREKSVLVNWVLPYAQRYMYTLHSDKYFQLQQSGFENLSQLRIMVVEKLHYQHTIKGHASSSSTQHECGSLLQDNILYVDRVSDSHSLFLELSRLFFNGNPELHFANFLHMVTTMAESGSTEEQTELFIMNSQKIPKLPDEEPVWFLSSLLSLQEEDGNPLPICSSATLDDRNLSKPKRKQSAYANWPPANWKTAPDFSFAQENRFRAKLGADSPKEGSHTHDRLESSTLTEHPGVTIGVGVDWVSQVDIVENGTASLLQDRKDQPPLVGSCTPVHGMADNISDLNKSDGAAMNDTQINERDQLIYGTPNAYQATVTGKVGEFVAFKYFIEKVGGASVRWVNQEAETGLPYDLIIGENEENREYIEVKSTKSASKDWFRISTREWQFALEKGDSFSVAHVVLLGPNNAKVTIYKNPLRLCQQGVLQLAVLIAKS